MRVGLVSGGVVEDELRVRFRMLGYFHNIDSISCRGQKTSLSVFMASTRLLGGCGQW